LPGRRVAIVTGAAGGHLTAEEFRAARAAVLENR